MPTHVNSTKIKVGNILQVVCPQTESYCGSLFIKRKYSIAYSSSKSAGIGNIVFSHNFSQHRYTSATTEIRGNISEKLVLTLIMNNTVNDDQCTAALNILHHHTVIYVKLHI
jgi:hypothetical protein